jgi:ArsR family transcriptional regulator, lead/cadmium/zinc/bismuth-responsive transcriptional repressor
MSMRSYVSLRPRLLGEASVAALAETFRALGDTTRVRMLDALSHAELCVQDLADLLGLTQSAVSHQLRLLRAMRLVRTRRDGRLMYYALDDDHIVKLFEQGLGHVEEHSPAASARLTTSAKATVVRRSPRRRRKAGAPDVRDQLSKRTAEREAAAERPARARLKVRHP